jgi:hypothetical protein
MAFTVTGTFCTVARAPLWKQSQPDRPRVYLTHSYYLHAELVETPERAGH